MLQFYVSGELRADVEEGPPFFLTILETPIFSKKIIKKNNDFLSTVTFYGPALFSALELAVEPLGESERTKKGFLGLPSCHVKVFANFWTRGWGWGRCYSCLRSGHVVL